MNNGSDHRTTPPKMAERFLLWFLKEDLAEEVLGDLDEKFFATLQTKSVRKARLNYWFQVINYLRPFALKSSASFNPNHFTMFRNYFKIGVRNLLKRKLYAGINIMGLAIGIACCLLIFQFVVFEYSYDNFHENKDSIYHLYQDFRVGESDGRTVESTTGWALAPTYKDKVPEVKNYVRLHPEYDAAVMQNPEHPDIAFSEQLVFYADTSFFDVFTFPLASGSLEGVLQPGTMVISENIAKRYFKSEDPIGKMLDVKGWIDGTYKITGVMENVPSNAHLKYDALLPMEDLLQKSNFKNPDTGWGWTNFITYIQLNEGASIQEVENKFSKIFNEREETEAEETLMKLQPLNKVHFNQKAALPFSNVTDQKTVYFFIIIGIVTLFLAIVNYINLTTARALDRMREVSVRKVIGAKRRQLIGQFLTESAITVSIAILIAFALISLLNPTIEELTGRSLYSFSWVDIRFVSTFLMIALGMILFVGFYPAMALSAFTPVNLLKGKSKGSRKMSFMRSSFVFVQFTISIILLVGTLVSYNQLNFMRNKDLGVDIEQVMTISAPRFFSEGVDTNLALRGFNDELRRLSTVNHVASSHSLIGQGFSFNADGIYLMKNEDSEGITAFGSLIDHNFQELYKFEFVAGEGFQDYTGRKWDENNPRPLIINERTAKALGFKNPQEALQEKVSVMGNPTVIKGVIKDFHWSPAQYEQEKMILLYTTSGPLISVKLNTENIQESIAIIEDIYQELFPNNPFEYGFVDQVFETHYRNDQRFAQLFGIFTSLAILIACLGLFGLATYTAESRIKEIGIRKVLGANIFRIVQLLTGNFLKIVMLSILVAIPVSYYLSDIWLEDFAYKIDLQWWYFAGVGLLAIAIAYLTVGLQTLRAARVNPTECLKYE